MPLYVYEDMRTGMTVEKIMPVAMRDCVEANLRRVTAPQRVCVVTCGATDPSSADGSVPKALRDLESGGMSASAIAKEAGFSVDQLKKIWRTNDN